MAPGQENGTSFWVFRGGQAQTFKSRILFTGPVNRHNLVRQPKQNTPSLGLYIRTHTHTHAASRGGSECLLAAGLIFPHPCHSLKAQRLGQAPAAVLVVLPECVFLYPSQDMPSCCSSGTWEPVGNAVHNSAVYVLRRRCICTMEPLVHCPHGFYTGVARKQDHL